MKKKTDDLGIAVAAERELEVQLVIVRALKPLNRESRQRVMDAASHLLEADARIPGVLRSYLSGAKAPGVAK